MGVSQRAFGTRPVEGLREAADEVRAPGLCTGRGSGEWHSDPKKLPEVSGTPLPASLSYTAGCVRPQSCFPESSPSDPIPSIAKDLD